MPSLELVNIYTFNKRSDCLVQLCVGGRLLKRYGAVEVDSFFHLYFSFFILYRSFWVYVVWKWPYAVVTYIYIFVLCKND